VRLVGKAAELGGPTDLFDRLENLDWHHWLVQRPEFYSPLSGWGFSLPGVYVVWIGVICVMYLPCRWFAGLEERRSDWWLSYL